MSDIGVIAAPLSHSREALEDPPRGPQRRVLLVVGTSGIDTRTEHGEDLVLVLVTDEKVGVGILRVELLRAAAELA